MITRDYYEQSYGNKMDNIEKKDKFLEMYSLSRLNHEGFLSGLVVENLLPIAGDMGLIPSLGRSHMPRSI